MEKVRKNKFADNDFWENEFYSEDKKILWDNSIYANKKIHSLLKKHLPREETYKILEVGCYPGSKLIFMNKNFNYSVYGVELIEKSAEKTRLNLEKFGVDGKIIHSDFLDKSFLKEYDSYFNVILDYGFSEHFNNYEEIINNYSKLLKKGGYVIIIIPNLGGIYRNFLSKNLLDKHNLKIMDISIFERTISKKFNRLFCDYIGSLYTDSSGESNIALAMNNRFIINSLIKLFKLLNKIMIYSKPFESKMFSPYLMYLGRKNEAK